MATKPTDSRLGSGAPSPLFVAACSHVGAGPQQLALYELLDVLDLRAVVLKVLTPDQLLPAQQAAAAAAGGLDWKGLSTTCACTLLVSLPELVLCGTAVWSKD